MKQTENIAFSTMKRKLCCNLLENGREPNPRPDLVKFMTTATVDGYLKSVNKNCKELGIRILEII